ASFSGQQIDPLFTGGRTAERSQAWPELPICQEERIAAGQGFDGLSHAIERFDLNVACSADVASSVHHQGDEAGGGLCQILLIVGARDRGEEQRAGRGWVQAFSSDSLVERPLRTLHWKVKLARLDGLADAAHEAVAVLHEEDQICELIWIVDAGTNSSIDGPPTGAVSVFGELTLNSGRQAIDTDFQLLDWSLQGLRNFAFTFGRSLALRFAEFGNLASESRHEMKIGPDGNARAVNKNRCPGT